MSAILPEEDQDELPTGFTLVGHVAHLNLREGYLRYRSLIATVLIDKNPAVKTVINKIDDVGTASEYRTFNFEVLAGEPNLNVETKEQDCLFRFDYSKVYWNSRLSTEHERLVAKFREGEAVCDAMAGVGPFAVPAGKRSIFVWANDLNPDSYKSLEDAIKRNHVTHFVRPFNEDARTFISHAVDNLLQMTTAGEVIVQLPQETRRSPSGQVPAGKVQKMFRIPRTFGHFVMNLPASALTFLEAFIGVYCGGEGLFEPHTNVKLPMVHAYCFSTKSEDNAEEKIKICAEISDRIQHTITPDTPETEIWDVRDVAPQKRMFCASFRLPAEVAFRNT
ncbi:MAG: tRNA(m(1)G37)methyltransferase [Caeruleum heppii]|nr:MAG: tRNA(m(1)G37)methyltransferase [Caeruleum heppii]